MNYWFLYYRADGSIFGSPYQGEADEWTNIPEGCDVIGPIRDDDATAADAFNNPQWYNIQNGELVPHTDIDAKKAARESENQKPKPPTLAEEIANLKKQNANFALIFAKHNMK